MKAVALFSGGLDSIIAVKLIESQGITVQAITFESSFFSAKKAKSAAKANNINLKVILIHKPYLEVVRNAKYGYGSGINPCKDCKIFMLKQAWKYAKKIGADFIFTGEVLNQRPMSQTKSALDLIEYEAGVKGKLIRPLSALKLKITDLEKKGKLKRENFLSINGRSRKEQIKLAKKFNIKSYSTPAGGCILCEKVISARLRDLFEHKKHVSINDAELIKLGRHFRVKDSKIIIGRNEEENNKLMKLKQKNDYIFEVKNVGSPVTLLKGRKSKKIIRIAAELTARYSDARNGNVEVNYSKGKIIVKKPLSFSERKYMII